MLRPLSPIHAPLENEMAEPTPPAVSRIDLLAALDYGVLSGNKHYLGAGGASAVFSRAVSKALVDEIAEQLREGPFEPKEGDSDLRKWAGEIIEAFSEE